MLRIVQIPILKSFQHKIRVLIPNLLPTEPEQVTEPQRDANCLLFNVVNRKPRIIESIRVFLPFLDSLLHVLLLLLQNFKRPKQYF